MVDCIPSKVPDMQLQAKLDMVRELLKTKEHTRVGICLLTLFSTFYILLWLSICVCACVCNGHVCVCVHMHIQAW